MLAYIAKFEVGTPHFGQFCRFCLELHHTILIQSVNISIVFYHKHLDFKEKVKSFGYVIISKNGGHSKMWDTVLVKLLYLTDPECRNTEKHYVLT